eukprot:1191625-Prorocentrum_minimum.AAC.4
MEHKRGRRYAGGYAAGASHSPSNPQRDGKAWESARGGRFAAQPGEITLQGGEITLQGGEISLQGDEIILQGAVTNNSDVQDIQKVDGGEITLQGGEITLQGGEITLQPIFSPAAGRGSGRGGGLAVAQAAGGPPRDKGPPLQEGSEGGEGVRLARLGAQRADERVAGVAQQARGDAHLRVTCA